MAAVMPRPARCALPYCALPGCAVSRRAVSRCRLAYGPADGLGVADVPHPQAGAGVAKRAAPVPEQLALLGDGQFPRQVTRCPEGRVDVVVGLPAHVVVAAEVGAPLRVGTPAAGFVD